MHILRYLGLSLMVAALGPGLLQAADADKPPDRLIGYTEFRTDLPGGRYVNQATFRAVVVKADGTGRRVLAEELTVQRYAIQTKSRRRCRIAGALRGGKCRDG